MPSPDSTACFRFAPSPTGYLHLGHAYAALMASEAAREMNGRFLLRIEDIDPERCRPHFEDAIYEDLAWLGITWEEPVRRQSDEMNFYAQSLDALAAMNVVYPCFCSRAQILANSQGRVTPDEAPLYAGTCRNEAPDARAEKLKQGLPHQLRLDMAKALKLISRPLFFDEEGYGPEREHGRQEAKPELFGDAVLGRKEVPASYHLCVVLDDALQGITHVTRGEDLFPATHIHRLLQALLDLPVPLYRHHGLIRDDKAKRLSKHDKATSLRALRQAGLDVKDIRALIGLDEAH